MAREISEQETLRIIAEERNPAKRRAAIARYQFEARFFGDKNKLEARRKIHPLAGAHVEDMDNYTFLRQEEEHWRSRRENR